MPESNVKITVAAEDKATPVLNRVNEAFKQYKASYESIGQFTARQKAEADQLAVSNRKLATATDEVASSNRSLFTTFTAASLAAQGIQRAISFAIDATRESIQAANEYQAAMAGLASAAGAFGQNIQATQQAAVSASSDGLVPLTANVAALRDLLQSGLSLDQATTLLARMKDEAAFGRAQTIDYGTAVENLAQAFKTEQSMLGNLSGHAENFSLALERGAAMMGKNVNQLSEAERVQAKYLGYLQASAFAQGNAAEYAETAAGKQAKLNYENQQAAVALGSALQPALSLATQSYVDFIRSVGLTQGNLQNAQGAFVTLTAVVAQAANIFVSAGRVIVGSIQSIAAGSLDPLKNALKESMDQAISISINWQKSLQDIAEGSSNTAVAQAEQTYNAISGAASKAAQKMREDLERENRNFAESMEKRRAQFEESMRDMIIAHRDKARSIRTDIAEENAAYDEQVKARQEALQQDMAELEDNHAKKVADITKKISEEKQQGIVVDGVLYANANQQRLDELQNQLDEEEAAFTKAQSKRQAQYDKDTQADKKRHQDKLTQLQTALDEETAILQKHAADVAAVGEAQREDDISRLKRRFAEENAENLKQHQQRLIDIRKQGAEQGATYGASMADAWKAVQAAKAPEIKSASQEQGRQAGEAMRKGFMDDVRRLPGDIAAWIDRNTGAITGLKTILKAPGDIAVAGLNFLTKNLLGFAEGGVITRPTLMTDLSTGRPYGVMAEAGPEAIVPVGQMGGSSGMTVHIGTQVFNSNLDQTSFLRQLYWEGRR